jgi:two-component system, LuxR family, response regulator FixJ
MSTDPVVFVVDDDEQARKSVCALVHSMGLETKSFSSAEDFLSESYDNCPGCLVTDLRMVGMNGLELQEEMARRKIPLPVIILTAYARTPITVCAMKAGAILVLDKPYRDGDLGGAIRSALSQDASERSNRERRQTLHSRLASLDSEEQRVLDLIVRGMPNKTIAKELNVSLRTIENRRHDIFRKFKANSLAELILHAMEAKSKD